MFEANSVRGRRLRRSPKPKEGQDPGGAANNADPNDHEDSSNWPSTQALIDLGAIKDLAGNSSREAVP